MLTAFVNLSYEWYQVKLLVLATFPATRLTSLSISYFKENFEVVSSKRSPGVVLSSKRSPGVVLTLSTQ